jgi:hypothetical protein
VLLFAQEKGAKKNIWKITDLSRLSRIPKEHLKGSILITTQGDGSVRVLLPK